jgi:hypothetical protein
VNQPNAAPDVRPVAFAAASGRKTITLAFAPVSPSDAVDHKMIRGVETVPGSCEKIGNLTIQLYQISYTIGA